MPELSDDMYCSQQIMVPPMFPYILRQYAKAAIRSQPTDLLRWSTAYFRCLSLNLPPPVKPRLEYPLPKDYDGVTPGWLKALLYQLINNTHVNFKVLWDRWIGACQNHLTLVKVLCLGGFTDPMAVPLLRFVGICTGFLSENLTQTMIMFCEVVTEEPEGGSAMIPVETFIDVYTFLANIEASKDQIILNRYFPEELLELLEKKKQKEKVKEEEQFKVQTEKEASTASELVEEESKTDEDQRDAVSCPDLDDRQTSASSESSDILDQGSKSTIIDDKDRMDKATGKTLSEIEMAKKQELAKSHLSEAEGEMEDLKSGSGDNELMGEVSPAPSGMNQTVDAAVGGEQESESQEAMPSEPEKSESQEHDISPLPSVTKSSSTFLGAEDDGELATDVAGVTDATATSRSEPSDDLTTNASGSDKKTDEPGDGDAAKKQEEYDKYLQTPSIAGESITETFDLKVQGELKAPVEELGEYSIAEPEEEEEMELEGKFTIEEIFVEAIPGIGPVVPNDLIEVVVEYMKLCAAEQQGMVMPRNIRHYSCPPLEAYQN